MSNVFDRMSAGLHKITTRLMGYEAVWQPSGGGTVYTEQVNFKEPTRKESVGYSQVDYTMDDYTMEYQVGQFPDLKNRVNTQEDSSEYVTINGIQYVVQTVTQSYDGRTYKAKLALA